MSRSTCSQKTSTSMSGVRDAMAAEVDRLST
jgi:hypothetical protein